MHICGVCFMDMLSHPSACGEVEDPNDLHSRLCYHMAPLCCPGCPCRSFEEVHPESERAVPVEIINERMARYEI